jgi:hypothetical protein
VGELDWGNLGNRSRITDLDLVNTANAAVIKPNTIQGFGIANESNEKVSPKNAVIPRIDAIPQNLSSLSFDNHKYNAPAVRINKNTKKITPPTRPTFLPYLSTTINITLLQSESTKIRKKSLPQPDQFLPGS